MINLSPVPGSVQTFTIDVQVTPGHAVAAITLLRTGVVTHHFDSDQRYIELEFSGSVATDGTATLTVNSPGEHIAPPGYYMIFVNEAPSASSTRATWAPSIGQFVRFQ